MRMVRPSYCWWRPLVCAMVFLFCCVILKICFHLLYPLESMSYVLLQPSPEVWSNIPSQPVASCTIQNNIKCSANDSMEVIPPHLPQSYQEFLRYRRCRAYPTLLTPSPCEDDLYLLLAIKSTAVNVERRAAVRDTWGQVRRIQGQRVQLVFLMGRSHDQVQGHKLQPLLEWESRRYGDILQWDFVDVFLNLTQKEVGFLNWFRCTCQSAQFVFKGDDDVFVNTENLIEFLKTHKPENHLFAGYIHAPELPIRDRYSKYFVPVEMYPFRMLYPPFPSGGGYLMSQQTVLGLEVSAQKLKLFPLDDVFLGMCLYQMRVNLIHHKGFLTFGFSNGLKKSDPCAYRKIMMVHTLNPIEMRVMWVLMQDNSPPCD